MKNTITTYSKIQFSPLQPDPNDIYIRDIAHALSFLTRANGHFKTFYSVAQHCIDCCLEAKSRGYSVRVQLSCLLHDASEAYISDITRPVKKHLPAYAVIEKKLQDCIYDKLIGEALNEEEKSQTAGIDDAMLYWEFKVLMDEKLFEKEPGLNTTPDFSFHEFSLVENKFLDLFHLLKRQLEEEDCGKSDTITATAGING